MYTLLFVMSGVAGVEEFFMTYPIILLQVLLSQVLFCYNILILSNSIYKLMGPLEQNSKKILN